MTTTSTTNFVQIESDDASLYSSWSSLEGPSQLPPGSSLSNSPNHSPHRRLQKRRRPAHLRPAVPPSEVLARNAYNYRDPGPASSDPQPERPPLESKQSSSILATGARSISQKFANRLENFETAHWTRTGCVSTSRRRSRSMSSSGIRIRHHGLGTLFFRFFLRIRPALCL